MRYKGSHPPLLYTSDYPQNKLFPYSKWNRIPVEIDPDGHVLQGPVTMPFHRGLGEIFWLSHWLTFPDLTLQTEEGLKKICLQCPRFFLKKIREKKKTLKK